MGGPGTAGRLTRVIACHLPDILTAEDQLVEAKRNETFERLFREHHAAVRRYALRRAPHDMAADVVAETFLVAWRRLDDVPTDPLPWLYGVARRVLSNARRSADRGLALERRLAAAAVPAGISDPGESIGEAEVVRAALARLSERDRETLMLVAWEELSSARAARAAGCTRAAFAVRLHRARARLAEQLASLESPAGGPVKSQSLEMI
jgi:RNA polymerase sigma-70 factor, ECF subfamily